MRLIEKAHHNLIKYAFDQGHVCEVDDGEERFKTKTIKETIEAVESVEAARLMIHDTDGSQTLGAALIINDPSGCPEESVADYVITPFMQAWDEQYSTLSKEVGRVK